VFVQKKKEEKEKKGNYAFVELSLLERRAKGAHVLKSDKSLIGAMKLMKGGWRAVPTSLRSSLLKRGNSTCSSAGSIAYGTRRRRRRRRRR